MRTSIVRQININTVSASAVFQVGDSYYLKPYSIELAVQREISVFLGSEGHFIYPIFTKKIPQPIIHEDVNMRIHNINPTINVDNVNIIGIASSAIFQVGSNQYMASESRTKHIRQLIE